MYIELEIVCKTISNSMYIVFSFVVASFTDTDPDHKEITADYDVEATTLLEACQRYHDYLTQSRPDRKILSISARFAN